MTAPVGGAVRPFRMFLFLHQFDMLVLFGGTPSGGSPGFSVALGAGAIVQLIGQNKRSNIYSPRRYPPLYIRNNTAVNMANCTNMQKEYTNMKEREELIAAILPLLEKMPLVWLRATYITVQKRAERKG